MSMPTSTQIPGWITLAEDPPVLVKEYSFGPGRANALAVGMPEGKWLIISPPPSLTRTEADAFAQQGGVVALVANNGAHHLGLGPSRALFPQAVTYAAPRAAARIRKKGQDYGELETIEKLRPLLGDRIAVVPVAGDKIGDVLLRVRTEKGVVLYAGDFIANMPQLPDKLLFRLIFRLTDSAPGLKVFKMFFTFFVADRKAACADLIRELEANPPAILVPAHGDVDSRADLGPTLLRMLRAM